jgi:hypothetical protein
MENYTNAERMKYLAYLELGGIFLNLVLKYYVSFTATIWASPNKGLNSFEPMPNGMGTAMVSCKEMEIYIDVTKWSDLMNIYYFSHMLLANMKFIILIYICFKIRDMFIDIATKRIFDESNIKVFRSIGFAILSIPIFDRLATLIMTLYVSHHPELYANLNITLSTAPFGDIFSESVWFVYGQFCYLAIIEIFNEGLELKSENDLTV